MCVEVADTLAWRRFCRIPLGERVPHPTTLMKITSRCGQQAVDELNEVLLAKAHEEKPVRLDRVRADTTVVEANVAYPPDSGLLAKGVAKMGVLVATLTTLGLATRTRFVDRTRSVRRRAHDIGCWLRRRNDDAKDEVQALNLVLADIATLTIAEAGGWRSTPAGGCGTARRRRRARRCGPSSSWSGAPAWSSRSPPRLGCGRRG